MEDLKDRVVVITGSCEGIGLEIASAEEAREILQLKGSDKVNF